MVRHTTQIPNDSVFRTSGSNIARDASLLGRDIRIAFSCENLPLDERQE